MMRLESKNADMGVSCLPQSVYDGVGHQFSMCGKSVMGLPTLLRVCSACTLEMVCLDCSIARLPGSGFSQPWH